jgi:hypothetical protein
MTAAGVEVLEPLARAASTPQSLNVRFAPEGDGSHALAWSHLHTGEEAKAKNIVSALMADNRDEAQALLERGTDAGWRDCYVCRDDPYWSSLKSDPRFRSQTAKAKADDDRQRAEVERIDASDDFIARRDAALASRGGSDR